MDNRSTLTEPDEGVAVALAELEAAVLRLTAAVGEPAALDGVGDEALLEGLRLLERVRNRLAVPDQVLLAETARRELPQRYCQGTVKRFLAGLLRLSPPEAARRVRASEALTSRLSPLGQPLPPVRPVLAAAQHGGEVSPEQSEIVLAGLAAVDHRGFDPAEIAAAEELLTGFCSRFGPVDLRRLAQRTVEAIDPDGTVPPDRVTSDRRHLTLRQGRDGMWRGEFRLTPVAGAKLETVLHPLARDRSTRLTDSGTAPDLPVDGLGGDGGVGAGARPAEESAVAAAAEGRALADERSHPQRLHDALEEACDLLLRSPALPDSGGTPATVIVSLTEDQLRRTGRAGTGRDADQGGGVTETADGATVAVRDLAHLAGAADVRHLVTDSAGAPLWLGRSRRIASPSQTLALIARDRGCSFPGCDRPPRWCERHHIVAWYDGGTTDLDNLTLLCSYHHRHHLDRGWAVRLDADGLPEWIPPAWIDPHRRPRTNHRILSSHRTLSSTTPGGRRPRSSTGTTVRRLPVPPARRSRPVAVPPPVPPRPPSTVAPRTTAAPPTTPAPPGSTPPLGSVLHEEGWWHALEPSTDDEPDAPPSTAPGEPVRHRSWRSDPVPEPLLDHGQRPGISPP